MTATEHVHDENCNHTHDEEMNHPFEKGLALYEERADYNEVIALFEEGITLSPRDSVGYTCLAWLLLLRNEGDDSQKAEKLCMQGLRLDPSNYQAHFNLALAMLQNKTKGVRQEFQQAMRKLAIDLPERPTGTRRHEHAGYRERCRHADLVFHVSRNNSFRMKPVECVKVADRIIGVTCLKHDLRRIHSRPEAKLIDLEDDLPVKLDELKPGNIRIDFQIGMLE